MDRRKTDRRDGKYGDIYVLDVQALTGILWRRRLLALALMLIVLIPGILFVMLRPTQYSATAAVFIGDEEPDPANFESANELPKFDEVTVDTQQKLLTSTAIAERTVQALEAKGVPLKGLPKQPQDASARDIEKASPEERTERIANVRKFMADMTVVSSPRSRVIGITYTTDDPFVATEVANTHMEEYLAYAVETKRDQARVLNEWISKQVEQLKGELRTKSQAVQDYRKQAGIMLGTNQEDLIYQQISDISQQLVPIATLKANLEARKAALSQKGAGAALGEVVTSPLIQNLKTQGATADQETKSLTANLGPNHPAVLAAKKRASQARADVARETGTIGQSIEVELKAVTEQENLLHAKLDTLNKQAEELREKEITLESLTSEETASRTLLETFLQRNEQVKAQTDLNQSNVDVFARAEVPTTPSGVSKTILLLLVIFASVVFAVALSLALELLDRGIEMSDDIKKTLNIRYLGGLPKMKNALQSMQARKSSPYLEEIKRIYLALSAKTAAKTVLFTASRRGEGRSTTVLALARYFRSAGAKIILVDTDHVARSSAADKAGVADAPGIAEYLAGRADIVQIVQRDEDGLPIIAPGNHATAPIDFLATGGMSGLLSSLKSQYDYVFVNAPPALTTTDAEILTSMSDQVILVIERARVPKKHLAKVVEMLRQYAKDVPGAILTKA